MPYAKIETNVKLGKLKEQKLLKAASVFFAILLEKSEEHVMVAVSHDTAVILVKTAIPQHMWNLRACPLKKRDAQIFQKKSVVF